MLAFAQIYLFILISKKPERYFHLPFTDYRLEQGFTTGALGPPWGPWSGFPGTTSRGFIKLLCRDIAKHKTKIGIFFDEQGATSVESLWKGPKS